VAAYVIGSSGSWFLYVLRCADGSLYTGITTDVSRRLAEHNSGGPRAARYVRGRAPLTLVYSSEAGDRASASSAENRIKRLDVEHKQALIVSQMPVHDWLLANKPAQTSKQEK
jgi:putative endonuclease